MPINRVVTHVAPHLDELFAYWLLRKFGEDTFSGVSTAPLELWDSSMENLTWQEHEAAGTLLLGVGGGPFDEHPHKGAERKEGQTATSLVASALGLMEHEALKRMINYVMADDLKGGSGPYELTSLVVMLNREHPDNFPLVFEWSMTAIEALLGAQIRFFTETRREFEAKARITTVRCRNTKIKIAVIDTDNTQIQSFARSKLGGHIAVVITRNSRGQIAIMSNRFYRLKFAELARLLRIKEYRLQHGYGPAAKWPELEAEGTLESCKEWHYFPEGEMLFNGNPTHPDVPPTALSLEQIVELAVIAFSTRDFEPERQDDCRNDVCSHTGENPCPWYQMGLVRCRSVRHRMKQKSGKTE